MARQQTDTELDRLFQLPLDAFTAARNALAKETGDADIKTLTKPPVAAWAVNQLYWRERDAYDALIEAATALRASHKAVLGGRQADLRAAGRAHEEAVEAALKTTLGLLAASGHPVTDATRQAILNTLRALPSGDPPGRLTRTLQPGGFEMLAGISIAPGRSGAPARAAAPAPAPAARSGKGTKPVSKAESAREQREREAAERAKEAAAEAQRELREAEQTARREEFESARATREAERAARRLESARERLESVQQDYDEAERASKEAERARELAERAAAAAAQRLDAARKKADS